MEKLLPVIIIMAGATVIYFIIGYKFMKKNKDRKNGNN
jgi:hypothetical protein